jgi:hypothetical protein
LNKLYYDVNKNIYIHVYITVKLEITVTRGFQEPVIAHLVFNLTSKVDRKWVSLVVNFCFITNQNELKFYLQLHGNE